ncbi:hypothetical protein [Sphingobacterium griseoflavum]|uniref:Uncharacterized protein n=1 Tax=Sphingobacterium griseoflavum TaxID=1474952 RepID=A0ABQ3I1S1_9SPHI|nr:hypothetical protein [Sphingobacterium griseoflavum]GHE47786.1 hypothetical protein GCM10017764_33730 [Sphingobacterium griseoflavum]
MWLLIRTPWDIVIYLLATTGVLHWEFGFVRAIHLLYGLSINRERHKDRLYALFQMKEIGLFF